MSASGSGNGICPETEATIIENCSGIVAQKVEPVSQEGHGAIDIDLLR